MPLLPSPRDTSTRIPTTMVRAMGCDPLFLLSPGGVRDYGPFFLCCLLSWSVVGVGLHGWLVGKGGKRGIPNRDERGGDLFFL